MFDKIGIFMCNEFEIVVVVFVYGCFCEEIIFFVVVFEIMSIYLFVVVIICVVFDVFVVIDVVEDVGYGFIGFVGFICVWVGNVCWFLELGEFIKFVDEMVGDGMIVVVVEIDG